MANVPPRVAELIETFDRNIDAYRSQQYNEAQLRREFIDPFFEELGWDVTNIAGNAQAYKDVIHEDAVKIGGYTKAPDYSFRIGGVRKFFLEAKKPSIDIKGDPHPAYQLRRYAWSAKLPLSILTDFEEFAVYDCQTRPKLTDRAGTARIMYLNYKEYVKRWSDIESIFSKDAIYKGSFDKFAVSTKGKRGTTTVDKEFLEEIEKWREQLAKIIAHKNRTLTVPQINFAVQRTIDRIIFLRMAEDRGIEHYGQLQGISSGDRTYPRLCELFEKADHKYNSGLFYFQKEPGRPEGPDELTLNLVLDDNPLKYILHSLYYPQCPYEFSVLPPEILGNVYEQFLGKVIQVSPGRRVKIEEKPEVKKAGGIYYTPTYIVDYIVKNTVGRLLECHCEEPALQATRQSQPSIDNRKSTIVNRKSLTPKQVSNLRILDPACGSGSFLLSAYTYLLNYHRDWYVENSPEKHTKKIYQGRGGQWFLTIAEKKQILLNNIFGVDIDSQAVEVTKLSLLLKVLEGETSETIGQTYKIFHERALPDLGNNIKCGNSLIGPDFFDTLEPEQRTTNNEQRTTNNEQRTNLDDLFQKINPFNYKAEFPHIFNRKNPGFNIVIGNPPWVQSKFMDATEKRYYEENFFSMKKQFDIFNGFVEKGAALLKRGGEFGYIIPNRFLMNIDYALFRQFLLDNVTIREIADVGEHIFEGVEMPALLLFFSNRPATPKSKIAVKVNVKNISRAEYDSYLIDQLRFKRETRMLFTIYDREETNNIWREMERCSNQLRVFVRNARGVEIGKRSQLVSNQPAENTVKFLVGADIDRYMIKGTHYLKLGVKGVDYKPPELYQGEKILIRKTGTGINAVYDADGYYVIQVIYIFKSKRALPSTLYLLGILNSTLMAEYYFAKFGERGKKAFPHLRQGAILDLPICTIDFGNPTEKAKHDKMVKLVERILDLHKRLTKAKVPAEKTRIQRQINTTDKQIDNLVYGLYNLTDEEIAIVER